MHVAFVHNLQRTAGSEQAEFDTPETVAAIAAALRRLGHEVDLVEASGPTSLLAARLEGLRPDLVFNTAEGERGRLREAFFPALFDRLELAWTGSDAEVCAVTLDKAMTRQFVAEAGVPVPKGGLVRRVRDLQELRHLRWPRMIKPNCEGSSKGIDAGSVVVDEAAQRSRVVEQLTLYPEGLLVEEYVEGIDVTVPFLELASPETGGILEPASYRFDRSDDEAQSPAIYDFELKMQRPDDVSVLVPADVPLRTRRRVMEMASQAVRALGIRDLGRLDFRVDADGQPWFIEADALPSLEPGASLYLSAAMAGLETIENVLAAVITSAADRQEITPRPPRDRALRVGLTFNLKRSDADEQAEHDPPATIAALRGSLEGLGYAVVELEATPDLPGRLAAAGVDLVFNIAEGWTGRHREAQVPALLELTGTPYTGSDPACMVLCLDKALAKRVVAAEGVPTPAFAVVHTVDQPLPDDLEFPVFVKPLTGGSSVGIDHDLNVVHDPADLPAAVARLARLGQPVLVEEYLPGREFTVGILAPNRTLLPIMEILPAPGEEELRACGRTRKTDGELRCVIGPELTRSERRAIEEVAVRAFEALGCRDVARIDLRQDRDGRIAFIECNPLPGLTPGWSDLVLCAEAAGLSYRSLVARILAPALGRLRDVRRRAGRASNAAPWRPEGPAVGGEG